jgi:hypothetical protein
MKKTLFVITLVIFSNMTFTSCKSSKKLITFEQVKIGKELDKVPKISLNDFFQIWIENKSKSELGESFHELFKDEFFTYFGEKEFKSLNNKPRLFKIESNILSQNFKNYKKIDEELIRQEFWNIIIPKTDLETHKKANCFSSSSSLGHSYELINNEIQVTLVWQFKCNGKKLINKTYKGNYDLEKMEFKK